jgi:hypothetical protein
MRRTNLLPDFGFHWNGTLEHLHHLERQKRRFYVSSIAVQEHFWDESPNALCNAYCEPAYSFGDKQASGHALLRDLGPKIPFMGPSWGTRNADLCQQHGLSALAKRWEKAPGLMKNKVMPRNQVFSGFCCCGVTLPQLTMHSCFALTNFSLRSFLVKKCYNRTFWCQRGPIN